MYATIVYKSLIKDNVLTIKFTPFYLEINKITLSSSYRITTFSSQYRTLKEYT